MKTYYYNNDVKYVVRSKKMLFQPITQVVFTNFSVFVIKETDEKEKFVKTACKKGSVSMIIDKK